MDNIIAGPNKQNEIDDQQPDRNDPQARLYQTAGVLVQLVCPMPIDA